MKSFFMSVKGVCFIAYLFFIVVLSCQQQTDNRKTKPENRYPNDLVEKYLGKQLDSTIVALQKLASYETKGEAMVFYSSARKYFKLAEPILAFADKENYLSLNQPNILKVSEEDATDIKIAKPFGFQVIEELLAENIIDKKELQKQAELTVNRLSLLNKNKSIKWKDYHFVWVMRDQIVRVATMGVTGFDSPLGNSLEESAYTYQTLIKLAEYTEPYFSEKELLDRFKIVLESSIRNLNTDFDSFDRYNFIKEHTHQQLQCLQKIIKDWKVEFPLEMAFNNSMVSLFSDSTFNNDFFNDHHAQNTFNYDKVALGKRLFNDVNFSKTKQMSCATCHKESLAFTDGLVTFPKQTRNTPTLKYAALQQDFFYDNRAGSLEGQIVSVVNNEHEFHTDLVAFTESILADTSYNSQFKNIYGEKISDQNIRNAIATYIRSLSPFNSKFDNNINGKENSLSEQEIHGFNLFMGKAQCATCHFAPVFNGTVPPYFTTTEMELLGVPEDTVTNQLDNDLGRYEVFKTEERKFFFKTPTVRNIATTAPYMHNGVFTTLDQVLEFYNVGGGVGLGMELEHQTLPFDSLSLNKEEMNAIIAFMKALKDA